MAARMTLRQYATHRRRLGLAGGTHEAVRKAIRSGRVTLGTDGQLDPRRADAEWLAKTRYRAPVPAWTRTSVPDYEASAELEARIDAVVPQLVSATDADAVTEIVDGLVLDVLAASRRRWEKQGLLPDFKL